MIMTKILRQIVFAISLVSLDVTKHHRVGQNFLALSSFLFVCCFFKPGYGSGNN